MKRSGDRSQIWLVLPERVLSVLRLLANHKATLAKLRAELALSPDTADWEVVSRAKDVSAAAVLEAAGRS